ncbi:MULTISPECIES: BglG family transcription antiterminator [Niallia]|nr:MULTISPECIES: BglG family transcription antiterminator [Niallia]NMO76765.1 transcription antiterminator [Niallia alba]UTI39967.1 BglG family transcription antiterminator [Niallia sp. RD1]
MTDLNTSNRIRQIFELTTKKMYCPLDYLAQQMGVSTRTVRLVINQFNKELQGIAELINERGKGFCLKINDQQKLNKVIENLNVYSHKVDSPQKRIATVINMLLNDDGIITMDEMAFQLNVGRTTLVNELKKASVALETYNLAIKGKQNKGMYLKGREIDLRFFILDNLFSYLFTEDPLDEDIKEEIINIANHYDFEISTRDRLLHSIIIMLDRLLKGYSIKEMDDKYHRIVNSPDFHIALEIGKVLEQKLSINIPRDEIVFIALPIVGRRTPINSHSIEGITVTKEITNLLDNSIIYLGFNLNKVKESGDFYKDLQYHLTFMINRLMFNIQLKNPLLDDIKEKYPLAYQMSEIVGERIFKEYGMKVSEEELGYIALYFGVFIENNKENLKKLEQVVIVCGTGRGTAKIVAMQLKKILDPHTKIDIFSENEVSKNTLDKYDIVFSTVNIPYAIQTPLVIINEIFDEKKVLKQIERISYLDKFKINENSSTSFQSVIKLLLNKQKFFILDKSLSYSENLNRMVDQLVLNGYVDDGFKQRLQIREEKGSMIFDKYIALPHTINYQSDKIELAIGIFPETVWQDNYALKIVFLLALPENTEYDASLLVKIYDEIINISSNTNLVNKMVYVENYEDLCLYLEDGVKKDS